MSRLNRRPIHNGNGSSRQSLRTCFEIENLVAQRLQLLPLPREIAMFHHSDFAGGRGTG